MSPTHTPGPLAPPKGWPPPRPPPVGGPAAEGCAFPTLRPGPRQLAGRVSCPGDTCLGGAGGGAAGRPTECGAHLEWASRLRAAPEIWTQDAWAQGAARVWAFRGVGTGDRTWGQARGCRPRNAGQRPRGAQGEGGEGRDHRQEVEWGGGCWAVGGCRSGGWDRAVRSAGPGRSFVARGCGAGVPGNTMGPCPACRGSQVLCGDPWGALSKHTPCSGRTQCPGTGGHGARPAEKVAAARPTPLAGAAPARGPKSTPSTPAGSLKRSLSPWAGSTPPTSLLEPQSTGGCGRCPSARLPGPAALAPHGRRTRAWPPPARAPLGTRMQGQAQL